MVQVSLVHQGLFLVVVHSALLTGAPRLGLEIAVYLQSNGCRVKLLSPEEGPLTREAIERGVNVLTIDAELNFRDLNEAVDTCCDILVELGAATVFCNSLASSLWAIAGKRIGAKVVLHALEMREEMERLLSSGRLVRGVGLCADALVVAAKQVAEDFGNVIGNTPSRVFELGSFVEPSTIQIRRKAPRLADWPYGREFTKTRQVVGMCGLGGMRKGFDRFVRLARQLPDYDFLWVGDATREPEILCALDEVPTISNLYVTGWVDNPLPFISEFDVFVLTSREDPNPISAIEAYCMGIPLIVFTSTGETWKSLRTGCYTCFGAFEEATAVRCIDLTLKVRKQEHHTIPAEISRDFALAKLYDFLTGI